MVDCGTSMPSMNSMRWDFFPVIGGPWNKRYADTLTRMPGIHAYVLAPVHAELHIYAIYA